MLVQWMLVEWLCFVVSWWLLWECEDIGRSVQFGGHLTAAVAVHGDAGFTFDRRRRSIRFNWNFLCHQGSTSTLLLNRNTGHWNHRCSLARTGHNCHRSFSFVQREIAWRWFIPTKRWILRCRGSSRQSCARRVLHNTGVSIRVLETEHFEATCLLVRSPRCHATKHEHHQDDQQNEEHKVRDLAREHTQIVWLKVEILFLWSLFKCATVGRQRGRTTTVPLVGRVEHFGTLVDLHFGCGNLATYFPFGLGTAKQS